MSGRALFELVGIQRALADWVAVSSASAAGSGLFCGLPPGISAAACRPAASLANASVAAAATAASATVATLNTVRRTTLGASTSFQPLPSLSSSAARSTRSLSSAMPPPYPRSSRLRGLAPGGAAPAQAEAGAAAAGDMAGQAIAGSLSKGFWQARQEAFNAIPTVPKVLGFSGAIPFLALTPYVADSLGFPEYIRDVAAGQVAYGALIVTFLGAVHWGIAMTSTLSGAKALVAQRERYIWSVFPSLAAWPALMMEPAPGSVCIALLLGICYMSDKAYAKTGSLPTWYMTLRGYLTSMAALSMLTTAAWFLARDFERAAKRMAEDDARRVELLSPKYAAPAAPPVVTEPLRGSDEKPPAKKKGWW